MPLVAVVAALSVGVAVGSQGPPDLRPVPGGTRAKLSVMGADGVVWRARAWPIADGGACLDVGRMGEQRRSIAITCHGALSLAHRIRRSPQAYAGGSEGGDETTQAVFGFVRATVASLTVIGLDGRRWQAELSPPFAMVGKAPRRIRARAFLAAVPGPRPRSARGYEFKTSLGSKLRPYWLGRVHRGLRLSRTLPEAYIYGDCDPPPDGGCAPPYEVQHHASCARNPLSLDIHPRRVYAVRGGGIAADYGSMIDVGIGRHTVTVFAYSHARAARAVQRLRRRGQSAPPASLPAPVYPEIVLQEIKRVDLAYARAPGRRDGGREDRPASCGGQDTSADGTTARLACPGARRAAHEAVAGGQA